MILPIYSDSGVPVKAHFSIEPTDSGWRIYLESRGGTIGTPSERNPGYAAGLRLLLARLAAARLCIADAAVASREAAVQALTPEERRLKLTSAALPISLDASTDVDAFAADLQRAQAAVGSTRKAGGGNTTRRLMLRVRTRPGSFPIGDIGALLSNGTAMGAVERDSVEEQALEMEKEGSFDPTNLADARKRVLASIAARQGQRRFRRRLLSAYKGRCAVSACDVEEVLEAAHILAYSGPHTNHIQNGLLLRGDLHTLFDCGLLGIDPGSWSVVLSPKLVDGAYCMLAGSRVRLPEDAKNHPSASALLAHLNAAGLAS